MMWRDLTLGEALKVKHGFAFKGEFFAPEGLLMVVTPGNFLEQGGFRVRLGKERFYTGEFPDDYVLSMGDLIVAMTEQGEGLLGSTARIPESQKYLHNQRIGLIQIVNHQLLDAKFLYWLFNSRTVREQLRGSSTGTKVRHTAPERIYKVRVRVPAADAQLRIATVLDRYDALIETNYRRIALLEESARLLYREWFVDFRFPGHEGSCVNGGLPGNWYIRRMGDVVYAIGGATPSTTRSDYWDGDIVWLTPTDVTRNDCLYLAESGRRITATGYESCSAKTLPPGTIFMTSRASIGYFALLDQPACTNQGFIAVIPKIDSARNFFLFNLMSRVEEFETKATGTTFKELTKKAFNELTVLVPAQEIVVEFEQAVDPIIEQVIVIKKQNILLTEARDALLPKLMSGEIQV